MVTRRVLTTLSLLAVVLCSAQARYRSYSREELSEGAARDDAITLSYSAVSARCLEYDYTMQVEFRSTKSGGFGIAATVSLGSFFDGCFY